MFANREIGALRQQVAELQNTVVELLGDVDAKIELTRIGCQLDSIARVIGEIKEMIKQQDTDKAAMKLATDRLNASSDKQQAAIDANQ